jgi:signal transduction histidine kinase
MTLFAQHNRYNINDELYRIYLRGLKEKDSRVSLLIADTMIRRSIEKGDKKAECIAYTIPLQQYYYSRNIPKFEETVDNLKRVARRNGYPQYYYHASNMYITRKLNDGETLAALQENVRMNKEAFEKKEPFGILSCIKNMARIQSARGNMKLADKYWREALDYQLKYVSEQDPTQIYMEIAEYSRESERYDEALEYNSRGMEVATSLLTKTKLVMQKCHIYYNMGDYDNFNKYYKEAVELEKRSHIEPTNVYSATMHLYERILNKDYDGAMAYADTMQRDVSTYMWKSVVAESFGDCCGALKYYRKSRAMKDSVLSEVQASDIAQMNTQVGNELLEAELERKKREAIELQLAQANQEVEMEQQRTANEHLQLANRELELSRLRSDRLLIDAENDRQRLSIERQLSKARYQRKIIIFGSLAGLSVLLGLSIALFRRKYMLAQLHKKNDELEVARDQADSANKMKTAFIQNMSHEIRTPLNSIVGFSQILTCPDMEVTKEEAQEYGQLIQQNSELLATLVNDLLGFAELESGKYTIRKSVVLCNEMCREALSMVMAGKPANVDVFFSTDADNDFRINTDSRRVKQVLTNFLTNAEKHTSEGHIELNCSLKSNPGSVTFSVTDTGCGVAPENVEKVFERFEKLNNFDTGFGLGLSLCRAIADRLGGTVHLDTSYTDGARFLFVLPLDVTE